MLVRTFRVNWWATPSVLGRLKVAFNKTLAKHFVDQVEQHMSADNSRAPSWTKLADALGMDRSLLKHKRDGSKAIVFRDVIATAAIYQAPLCTLMPSLPSWLLGVASELCGRPRQDPLVEQFVLVSLAMFDCDSTKVIVNEDQILNQIEKMDGMNCSDKQMVQQLFSVWAEVQAELEQ